MKNQFKAFMEKRLENLQIWGTVHYTKKGTAQVILSNEVRFEYAPVRFEGRVGRWSIYVKTPTLTKLKQALNKGIAAIIEPDRNPVHALRENLYQRATVKESLIDGKEVDRLMKKSGYSDDYCKMDEAAVKFWNEQFDKKTILKSVK